MKYLIILLLFLIPSVIADDNFYVISDNKIYSNNYKIILNDKIISDVLIDSNNTYLYTKNSLYSINKTYGIINYIVKSENIKNFSQTDNYIYLQKDYQIIRVNKTNGNIESKNIFTDSIDSIYSLFGSISSSIESTINNYFSNYTNNTYQNYSNTTNDLLNLTINSNKNWLNYNITNLIINKTLTISTDINMTKDGRNSGLNDSVGSIATMFYNDNGYWFITDMRYYNPETLSWSYSDNDRQSSGGSLFQLSPAFSYRMFAPNSLTPISRFSQDYNVSKIYCSYANGSGNTVFGFDIDNKLSIYDCTPAHNVKFSVNNSNGKIYSNSFESSGISFICAYANGTTFRKSNACDI